MSVTLIGPEGQQVEVDEAQVQPLTDRGFRVIDADERAALTADAAREEFYSSPLQKVRAAGAAVARGMTFGASDALARTMGAEEDFAALRETNPELSLGAEALSGLLTGRAAGLGVSKAAQGASTTARIAGAAKATAKEGVAFGAGSGVTEVSLSKDPITLERAMSTIGSHALFGGAVGGAAGVLGAGAGAALRRGKQSLDNIAARGTAEVDDATKAAFVDEVKAFRKQTVDDELFLTTKGAADRETKAIAKTWLEADRAVDRVLRNPKALAHKPDRVLAALQQQEHALEQVAAKADDLRAKFASDTSGTRVAALDKIPGTLERNRALQSKIAELTAKPAQSAAGGIAQNMLGGSAFGVAASAVGAIPGIGPLLAPLAGAAASKLVTDGIGKAMSKQAARMSKAIDAFLAVGQKVAPSTPVVASKVLASVAYGPAKRDKDNDKAKAPLARAYKARVAEVKAQTQYGPDGRAVMRPDARARVAENLVAIRAVDPIAADRMETHAARRIEAIANRIPRKPDVMAAAVGGPDRWQPPDMEMRALARFVAAIEDPAGVVERLADGRITPEDRDAMREVYPEMYAQIQMEILSKLPTLRATLPYQRRLALSIFSGVPVDPAMSPSVMQAMQMAYAEEGDGPQMPQPQFGSVKNQEATPSQERQMT